MTDGTGTTTYAYVPVGTPGALQLQQESSPLAGSAITSAYDALGRLSSRTVAGAGAETFAYDAIGRVTTHTSDLGSFTLSYLGQTGQITSRALTSSTLATSWSYLTNAGDRRLSGINNTGLSAGQYSNYSFTTTPENFIGGITETSDAAAVYPTAGTQTAAYNSLNQLTNLSGQPLTFDAVGNLTSDGARTYTWDAENRLLGIAYPGVSGKATAFTYDGLGRRVTIASTPAGGGSATTTSYLWCGDTLCQARNASNATTRSYYDEGEFVPGAPNQPYYYGIDQIGSVRRAFASTSSAPAYGYDPYGVPLQATAPVTDFVYGGMFYNADSGLYLTKYRAYDSVAGRWLSRDPLGELGNDGLPGTAELASNVTLMGLTVLSYGVDVPTTDTRPPTTAITQDQSALLAISLPKPNALSEASLYGYAESDPIFQTDPEGLAIQFYGPSGTRICGVICGGYGFRMDYGPNPSPTLLHFHFGPLSAPNWGGHRPWYAPWCTY